MYGCWKWVGDSIRFDWIGGCGFDVLVCDEDREEEGDGWWDGRWDECGFVFCVLCFMFYGSSWKWNETRWDEMRWGGMKQIETWRGGCTCTCCGVRIDIWYCCCVSVLLYGLTYAPWWWNFGGGVRGRKCCCVWQCVCVGMRVGVWVRIGCSVMM